MRHRLFRAIFASQICFKIITALDDCVYTKGASLDNKSISANVQNVILESEATAHPAEFEEE